MISYYKNNNKQTNKNCAHTKQFYAYEVMSNVELHSGVHAGRSNCPARACRTEAKSLLTASWYIKRVELAHRVIAL